VSFGDRLVGGRETATPFRKHPLLEVHDETSRSEFRHGPVPLVLSRVASLILFGFKPTARCCPLCRKPRLSFFAWYQLTGIGSVNADLDLTNEPGVIFSHILLLLHEVPHEISQKLRRIAVAGLRRFAEFIFQDLIDPEGKRCLAQGATSCVTK